MTSKIFDSVLCFGDSDWWYHNRGHADMQYMRRFARHVPVVYVNSLGVSMPGTSDGRMFFRRVARKCKSITRYLRDGGEGFSVYSPVYLPVRNGLLGHGFLKLLEMQIKMVMRLKRMQNPLIWVTCPTAGLILHRLSHAAKVYQYSDFYAAMSGGSTTHANQLENSIAKQADLILCTSDRLYERAEQLYGNAEYLDHGVDYDLFHSAAESPIVPDSLQQIKRPVIGFFGNIDSNTVDRELLDEVMRLRPEYTFVLVGSMAKEFESLLIHKNLIAIPRQPYHQVAQYGASFDVCIMPWLQNEWIQHCNPIKLKEYLALGKPVVSTPFPELKRYAALCYEASGAEAFAIAIDQALSDDNPSLQQQRYRCARENTWDAKYDQVITLLENYDISIAH